MRAIERIKKIMMLATLTLAAFAAGSYATVAYLASSLTGK